MVKSSRTRWGSGAALLALGLGCNSGPVPAGLDATPVAQDTAPDRPIAPDRPGPTEDIPPADVVDASRPLDVPALPGDVPQDTPQDTPQDVSEDVPQDVSVARDVVAAPDGPVDAGGVPLYAAGDISSCLSPFDEMTATLLDRLPGTILALGDNAYQSGANWEYLLCYGPTWGRHRARTRPVPGNHEYETRGARDYFEYFGSAAGRPGEGWYSFDHGGWHLVALNSNCSDIGGCGPDSPQGRWLRADLAAHPARCTLAYMHHPRFSSGRHGSSASMQPLWQMLYDANADVVLVGHDHHYERFAPMAPDGTRDPTRGIREFLVGTGGIFHYALSAPQPNSEVRNNDTHGVLQLTLRPDGYDWRFHPVAGRTFTDTGSAPCH